MSDMARQFYSPNAIIFNNPATPMEPADLAYYLATTRKGYQCVKGIEEATGYELSKWVNQLVFPEKDKVVEILNKHNIFQKITNKDMYENQKTLAKNELVDKLLKYSIASIRHTAKNIQVQNAKHIEIDNFVALVENRYLDEAEKRIPESSLWYKYPRFISRFLKCEIQEHIDAYKGNNTSCNHIEFIRNSDYELDPLARHIDSFEYKAFGEARYTADPLKWLAMLQQLRSDMASGKIVSATDNVIEFKSVVLDSYLDDMAEDMATDFEADEYE